jgi:hypothetical protein
MTAIDGVLYQPIPFREFADRPCERDSSEARFELLRGQLLTASRLLDLGCANGYFLFRTAVESTALVQALGIDRFDDNVELVRRVASLYGLDGRIAAERATIDAATVGRLTKERRWDTCLLLSVHHHLLRDLGLAETLKILEQLAETCELVIIEQGSLTQQEYELWTERQEPFSTGGFSRLVSMLEAAGIDADCCLPLGHGKYLSGLRRDEEGSRRVIVAFGRRLAGRGVTGIQRKAHKNGIFMEILSGPGLSPEERPWIWKNVVTGPSLAVREKSALKRLTEEPGFPRLWDLKTADGDADDGLVRMERLDLRPVSAADIGSRGDEIRSQILDRLHSLARNGILHNEVHPSHLQLGPAGELVLLDLETVYFLDEPREEWVEAIAEPNPAIGLGSYPRSLLRDPSWREIDLVATDATLRGWDLPALTAQERESYFQQLEGFGS